MVLIMSRKKALLLLVSFVFMMSLFANFVSAAETQNFLPKIIEEWATFLFVDLAKLANSSDDAFVIYSKFLFFWLVFTVLFVGASKVFPDKKNIAGTVAVILSIITIVMIPRSMMLFIFESYSIVISFFFGFLPFIVGFMLAHRVASGDEPGKKLFRGIIYIFIGIFTISFVGVLSGFEGPLYVELAKWTSVGGWIALVVGIWTSATSGGGGAGGGGGGTGSGGEHWWDRVRDWSPRRDEGGGVRTAEQEARIVRQMTETVTRMETNYAIMRGVANGAGVSLNNAITFAQRRAGGLAPGAATAGLPGFTPARITYLNDPARLGRLQNAYEQWTTDWNRLYANITNIARLNASLRARVIAQLSNPI